MTPHAPISPAGAHPIDAVARALSHDWSRLSLPRRLVAAHGCAEPDWVSREPELRGHPVREIPSLVVWSGFRPVGRGGAVLAALLRQAGEPLAARALLQALLPRLRWENVYTATFGHRLPEHAQETSDTAADLVAECFAAIARHAGEDRTDVDRLLVREAARRLRTARQGVHRYYMRTSVLTSEVSTPPAELFMSARSGPEWLACALVDAARKKQLDLGAARLIYEARVKGVPASEIGRRHGYGPGKVYPALARAERALLENVA